MNFVTQHIELAEHTGAGQKPRYYVNGKRVSYVDFMDIELCLSDTGSFTTTTHETPAGLRVVQRKSATYFGPRLPY